MTYHRRAFYKMSGSGNDFVMVDAMSEPPGALADPSHIQAICARGPGVGADGIVFLEPSTTATLRMTYLNRDGSRASMCGNASLCTARLALDLGLTTSRELTIETDSGILTARATDGSPEVDLPPVTDVRPQIEIPIDPGEERMGFAMVGVPHLVIVNRNLDEVDVVGRGRPLRFHERVRPHGANVNFVAPAAGPVPDGDVRAVSDFRVRTYERGVEAETLACGTGAIASAILLIGWGEAASPVRLVTRSGRPLVVRAERRGDEWWPSLRGEARLVFEGRFREI